MNRILRKLIFIVRCQVIIRFQSDFCLYILIILVQLKILRLYLLSKNLSCSEKLVLVFCPMVFQAEGRGSDSGLASRTSKYCGLHVRNWIYNLSYILFIICVGKRHKGIQEIWSRVWCSQFTVDTMRTTAQGPSERRPVPYTGT